MRIKVLGYDNAENLMFSIESGLDGILNADGDLVVPNPGADKPQVDRHPVSSDASRVRQAVLLGLGINADVELDPSLRPTSKSPMPEDVDAGSSALPSPSRAASRSLDREKAPGDFDVEAARALMSVPAFASSEASTILQMGEDLAANVESKARESRRFSPNAN